MLIIDLGTQPVTSVVFSTDGENLYAGCEDGSLVRVGSDGSLDAIGSFNHRVQAIAARPKTDEVYACCEEWIATIHPASPPGYPPILAKRTGSLTSIAFVTPDILVSGTGHLAKAAGGSAFFDDLAKNKPIGKAHNEAGGIRTFATHPPTKTVAWATGDRFIRALPLAKPDSVKIAFDQNANALTFSKDGDQLAVALGWVVRLIDWKTQTLRTEWKGHKGRVTSVLALSDGSYLTAAWDDLIKWWSPSGIEIRTFEFGLGKMNTMAVAGDGSRAAAGTTTGQLVMWDLS